MENKQEWLRERKNYLGGTVRWPNLSRLKNQNLEI